MKRALSFVLAIIMVLSLVPAVSAAETELAGLNVNGLSVTYGETKSVQEGELVDGYMDPSGTVEWSANGSQITAVATPDGEQVGATLTFQNNLTYPATLRFEYSFTRDDEEEPEYEAYPAEVQNLTGSPFEMELVPGTPHTITLISPNVGWGSANLTIFNISLSAEGEATVTFTAAENGTYTVGGAEITGETSYTVATGTKYAVSATAASGYRFFGWYNGARYISYKAADNITISENCTISPVFIKDDVAVFGVGEDRFQSLTEADAYASSSVVKTIVLMNDGILTGEHTISAGNTLLIPYDDKNSVHTTATPTATLNDTGNLWTNHDWEKPTAYRTLTMAAGAKLIIQGSLNVGGKHSAGPFLTAGSPSGDLGMIQMAEGSNITVANGGTLYCWGYIYGDGTVTAKNGAKVHENIQFTDFRGGNATAGIAMSFLVFPMTQYYVQNIEVAATYEYGAVEEVWGSIYVSGAGSKVYGTSVKFIGPDKNTSMFVPGVGGSVTKTYLPDSDRLQLDINGGGSINPMTLDMEGLKEQLGGQALNTETFVLPINNNMTINVKSGITTLNQSLGLLPGVELNISTDAVLKVNAGDVLLNDEGNPALYTGGHNLIVYDRDQWLSGWIEGEDGIEPIETYYVYSGKRLQPVAWSPTCSYTRTEADLVDAVLDINGTLITDGFVYTTVNIEPDEESELGVRFVGNTPIISSAGTGKVVMNNGAGQDFMTMQATQSGVEPVFVNLFMVSARLQNADGSYLDTMGAEPGATFSYCANCGQWYAVTDAPHTVEIFWIADGENFTQEACIGSKPVFKDGTDPVKDGYEFIGWSTEEDNEPEYATTEDMPVVTGEATYWACFREVLLGDVNQDDKLDIDDLYLLAKHVAGIAEITDEAGLAVADMSTDGIIDAYDLTLLARAYVDQYNASKNN